MICFPIRSYMLPHRIFLSIAVDRYLFMNHTGFSFNKETKNATICVPLSDNGLTQVFFNKQQTNTVIEHYSIKTQEKQKTSIGFSSRKRHNTTRNVFFFQINDYTELSHMLYNDHKRLIQDFLQERNTKSRMFSYMRTTM